MQLHGVTEEAFRAYEQLRGPRMKIITQVEMVGTTASWDNVHCCMTVPLPWRPQITCVLHTCALGATVMQRIISGVMVCGSLPLRTPSLMHLCEVFLLGAVSESPGTSSPLRAQDNSSFHGYATSHGLRRVQNKNLWLDCRCTLPVYPHW